MNNGPQLWNLVLEAVNFEGAVVAGGCIRDHHLQVQPKDIDVFVPCSSLEQWIEFKYRTLDQNSAFVDLLDTREGKEYETTDFSRDKNPLYGVLEGELCGVMVNIIARTSHTSNEALIELFDFGILQAYWDGGRTKFTKAQSMDCFLKRATLTHDRNVEQSIARFMRFNNRHPGLLSLNIPFEQFADAENNLDIL